MFGFKRKAPCVQEKEPERTAPTPDSNDCKQSKTSLLFLLETIGASLQGEPQTYQTLITALYAKLSEYGQDGWKVIKYLLADVLNTYSSFHPEKNLGEISAKETLLLCAQSETTQTATQPAPAKSNEDDDFARDVYDRSSEYLEDDVGLEEESATPIDKQEVAWEIDSLFQSAKLYRTGKQFKRLLDFVASQKWLGAYNALLVETQSPGTHYAISAFEWHKLGYRPKATARPLVILNFHPVGFVYDISDVERDPTAEGNIKSKPEIYGDAIKALANPFAVDDYLDEALFNRFLKLLAWHGIATLPMEGGADYGGALSVHLTQRESRPISLPYKKAEFPWLSGFTLTYNTRNVSCATQFATVCHELGHFFCKHLPLPARWDVPSRRYDPQNAPKSAKPWGYRPNLPHMVEELEAEAVAYLACKHHNLNPPPSDRYLASNGISSWPTIPKEVSIERIAQAVDAINKIFRAAYEGKDRFVPLKECFLAKYDPEFMDQYKAWQRSLPRKNSLGRQMDPIEDDEE